MASPYSEKFDEYLERRRNEPAFYPSGNYARKPRQRYWALLELVGTPSDARKLMDELELWPDERRPDGELLGKWTELFRNGVTIPDVIVQSVCKAYDAYRMSNMDKTLIYTGEAHRAISQSIVEGKFDKNYSGAYQHAGQMMSIGTEKREQTFNPRRRDVDGQIAVTPTFVLMPPPERQQLSGPVIEGEVVGR